MWSHDRCHVSRLTTGPSMLIVVPQMGGPAYNNQFMAHSGPRGPSGMAPGGMGPGPGPTRGPPSMGPMYAAGGVPQRVPQHPNYGPGPQQAHLRPQQGLKRPYNSEVRPHIQPHVFISQVHDSSHLHFVRLLFSVVPGNVSAVRRPRRFQRHARPRRWRQLHAGLRGRRSRRARPVRRPQHALPPRWEAGFKRRHDASL